MGGHQAGRAAPDGRRGTDRPGEDRAGWPHAGPHGLTIALNVDTAQRIGNALGVAIADAGLAEFVRRDVTRANATDPTAAPPGCTAGRAGDPVADADTHAAARAQASNFTHATQRAGDGRSAPSC